jgi:hypothetical protein
MTQSRLNVCPTCGIPLDSQYFDDSKVVAAPEVGREVLLARFELPPQYCGVLEYFAQFTDAYGKDPSRIHTPGLQWLLLINKRPLYPYTNLDRIVNPWGNGSFQVAIRLNENSIVEFQARRLSDQAPEVTSVAGRIVGRYWYNAAYGDVV